MSTTQNEVVEYPESDGQPMGETDWHIYWILRLRDLLQTHYKGQSVYVASDMFIYYEEGKPSKCVCPDGFVVFDCDPKFRPIFKIWAEGRSPSVIFEVTSESTSHRDLVEKPKIYAQLGVNEYFLFDPLAEYLDPPLQGFRLQNGQMVPMRYADGLVSQSCRCRLKVEKGNLVLSDLDTGELWLTQAEQVKRDAQRIHEENAQLREELERLRAKFASG